MSGAFSQKKSVVLIAAVSAALAFSVVPVEAKKRVKKAAAPRCVAQNVIGAATSTGILGLGSAKARLEAAANWEAAASASYGPNYASLYQARAVRWDCKKGALVLAKCVVIAKPCRA